MKIEKVTYQKAFVIGPYLQEKIGIEIQLDEHNTPEECLNAAKAIVEDWHKEANPHLQGVTLTSVSELPVIQQSAAPSIEHDAEFAALKEQLDKFETKEAALEFLQVTNWKWNVDAKNYINDTKK